MTEGEKNKANGGADPRELVAALASSAERTLVKGKEEAAAQTATAVSLTAALKKNSTVLLLLVGFVTQFYLWGKWTGAVETKMEASGKELSEVKAAIADLAADLKRANQDRVEDARQSSYIRAQGEVLGKQLAALQATLDSRR